MFRNADLTVLPNELKWHVAPLPPDSYLEGWFAGPMVTVAVHWCDPNSKPCRVLLTDGQVPCRCEHEPMSLRTVGYVPIIGKDKVRSVVLVSTTVAALIQQKYKPGDLIRISRPVGYNRPLAVTPLPPNHFGEALGNTMRQTCCHDIHEFLLHLWQDRELCDHFGIEFRPSVSAKRTPRKKKTG